MNKTVASGLLLAALIGSPVALANEVGTAAPDCKLQTLGDAHPLNLSQLRGKVVYVDFWASWCGPCAQSMPHLNKLYAELKGKGLEVIGVNVDENGEDARTFLKKVPVNFTVAADTEGQCPNRFNVQAMPSSYLIDRQGKIRQVRLGFRSGEAEAVRKEVETLLARKD